MDLALTNQTVVIGADLRLAAGISDFADQLPIMLTTPADVEAATSCMKQAGDLWSVVEKRRAETKKPFADIVKKIDAKAKTILAPLAEIEEKCKSLLRQWTYAQEVEKQRLEDEAMQQAETDGRETPDLTVAVVETFVPEVKTRQLPRVRITDESLLPDMYWVPNMALIESHVKAGTPVPGAEMYYETVIVNG